MHPLFVFRRAVILLCLFTVADIVTAQTAALDLRSAYRLLEERNEQLAAARERISQAEFQQRAADASRLPVLEIEGSRTRLDSPLEIDLTRVTNVIGGVLPGSLPGLIPSGIPIQDRNFGNLAIQAVQPLYLGGRIAAGRAAARAGVEAENAVLDRLQADLVVELVQRYFGQVVAADAVAVRQQSVDSLRQLAFNARRLEEEGEISRTERLRSDVALLEAEGELAKAKEELNLARAALAALLAYDEDVDTGSRIPDPPRRVEAAEWQAQAMDNNAAVMELAARLEQAEAGARAERGSLKPSVMLVGRRELYTQDLTLLEPEWAVSLRASWRFFDGGARQSRVSAAQAQVRELELTRRSAQRQIGLLVLQQIEAQHAALDRYASFSAAVDLAEDSLRAQRRAFEEGFATSLEVIDADLARSRVSLARLMASYEAWLATAALYAAAGSAEGVIDYIEEMSDD